MGYPLHGHELSLEISPLRARCGWAIGWKKDAFWGRGHCSPRSRPPEAPAPRAASPGARRASARADGAQRFRARRRDHLGHVFPRASRRASGWHSSTRQPKSPPEPSSTSTSAAVSSNVRWSRHHLSRSKLVSPRLYNRCMSRSTGQQTLDFTVERNPNPSSDKAPGPNPGRPGLRPIPHRPRGCPSSTPKGWAGMTPVSFRTGRSSSTRRRSSCTTRRRSSRAQGVPLGRRFDRLVPTGSERRAAACLGPPAGHPRVARGPVHRITAAVDRRRRPVGSGRRRRSRSICGRSSSPRSRASGCVRLPKYRYLVIGSPAGAYFKGGLKPVSVWLSTEYVHASPGGTGAAKFGGNYAASLAQAQAAENGCDQVVWLDALDVATSRRWAV